MGILGVLTTSPGGSNRSLVITCGLCPFPLLIAPKNRLWRDCESIPEASVAKPLNNHNQFRVPYTHKQWTLGPDTGFDIRRENLTTITPLWFFAKECANGSAPFAGSNEISKAFPGARYFRPPTRYRQHGNQ
jgi:hypothetical protein